MTIKYTQVLFKDAMIRAILNGTKTQTRRLMKPQPYHLKPGDGLPGIWNWDAGYHGKNDKHPLYMVHGESENVSDLIRDIKLHIPPPKGNVGDRMWVREAWKVHQLEGITGLEYPNILYRADSRTRLLLGIIVWKYLRDDATWRPSIFMPKWACRIHLEITRVRAQRIQDISTADCLAEGIDHKTMNDPRVEFQWLWDSINGKHDLEWNSNPWVWVYDFKLVEVDWNK